MIGGALRNNYTNYPVEIVKESELTDLFLYASAESETVERLLDEDEYEIELRMTDGDLSFHGGLKRADLLNAKHEKNTQKDSEWVVLLIQALLNELPISSIDTIEIAAKELSKEGSPVLEIELKTSIGPSIYQTLGVLEFEAIKDSDDINYADELFEWSKIMSDSNKRLHRDLLKAKAQTEDLKNELQKAQDFQTELVRSSKAKDETQLKVMTKLLNAKKEHYEQLSRGEIADDPDDFNLIAIKNIKSELLHEVDEVQSKVKRQKKAGTSKRQPRGVAAAALLRKRAVAKEHPKIKQEDEDEFISDHQEEGELKKDKRQEGPETPKIKEESVEQSEIQPRDSSKAGPEKSIHFKFNREQATEEEDDDATVDEKKSNGDDEEEPEDDGDETLEDTENDTEDDQEMRGQEEYGTVTATDTESDDS